MTKTKDEENPEKRCLRARAGGQFCLAGRCMWWLVTLALGLIFYLSLIGFPAEVGDRVQARLLEKGVVVDFDRLRLDPSRGLIADAVQLQLPSQENQSVLRCELLHLNLNWKFWEPNHSWLEGLGVVGGTFMPSSLQVLPNHLEQNWLTVSNLNTFVTFKEGVYTLSECSATLHGIPIQATGRIQGSFAQPAESPTNTLEKLSQTLSQPTVESFLDRIWPVMQKIRWSRDSGIQITFDINSDNPDQDHIYFLGRGGEVRIRGVRLNDWGAEVVLEGRTIECKELSAGHRGKRANFRGRYHFPDQQIELHGYSDLEPSCIFSLLPWNWAKAFQDEVELRGGVLETECWVGPASLSEALEAFSGWTKVQQAAYKGIQIEEGFIAWAWRKPFIELSRLKIRCGEGRQQGELTGAITVDTSNKVWKADMVSTVDPHAILPITPTNLVKLTKKFEFTGENPRISLNLYTTRNPDPALLFSGDFEAKEFSYQGVDGLAVQSGISYSNRTVRLDPFYVERDEGDIHGWLSVSGPERMSYFDLNSSVHPQALGQIVSTNIGRLIRKLEVEGIGSWWAKGQADLGGKTNSHFEVGTRLSNASLWRLQSKDLTLGFTSIATNLQFVIGESEIYGGSFTGLINIAQTTTAKSYTASFAVTNAVFDDVLQLLRTQEVDQVEGRFTGDAFFAGTLNPFVLPGTIGHGNVRVQEGTLFRLPIFGGLSKYLSMLFPGLGFSAQRDLEASFELKNEKISTEDMELSGAAVTIEMDGRVHVGHDLDFDVTARPLGQGVIADVVQLITLPISKLLEFKLEGTLGDPKWRPKHWPKELLPSGDDGGAVTDRAKAGDGNHE